MCALQGYQNKLIGVVFMGCQEINTTNICFCCFHETRGLDGTCSFCGSENFPNQKKHPLALPQGSQLLQRYWLGEILGQGMFDITYLALDTENNCRCVIREYFPEKLAVRSPGSPEVEPYSGDMSEIYREGRECFLSNAERLKSLSGIPALVPVRDCFEENHTVYYCMDYLPGINFRKLNRLFRGKMPFREMVQNYLPVFDALTHAHDAGILHLNLCPDHIYMSNEDAVTLRGFGGTDLILGRACGNQTFVYQSGYAPKELYMKKGIPGTETDVYSLSACIYHSLTGADPPNALARLDSDELRLVSCYGVILPDGFEEVLRKGMAIRQKDRFSTVEKLQEALLETM